MGWRVGCQGPMMRFLSGIVVVLKLAAAAAIDIEVTNGL